MSAGFLGAITLTSPEASMLVSSPTLSTAFFAVAVHTPPEQVTFSVAFSEIVTAACTALAAPSKPLLPLYPTPSPNASLASPKDQANLAQPGAPSIGSAGLVPWITRSPASARDMPR
jgi:hypothetical protein